MWGGWRVLSSGAVCSVLWGDSGVRAESGAPAAGRPAAPAGPSGGAGGARGAGGAPSQTPEPEPDIPEPDHSAHPGPREAK